MVMGDAGDAIVEEGGDEKEGEGGSPGVVDDEIIAGTQMPIYNASTPPSASHTLFPLVLARTFSDSFHFLHYLCFHK